jgi:hypothetical protein
MEDELHVARYHHPPERIGVCARNLYFACTKLNTIRIHLDMGHKEHVPSGDPPVASHL